MCSTRLQSLLVGLVAGAWIGALVGVAFAAPVDGGAAAGAALADLARDIDLARTAHDAHNATQLHMAIAAGIAAGLKLLIDLLWRLGLPEKAKRQLPLLCTALGAVATVCARYGAGSSWTDALIIGGAGPGAVLVNEISNALRRPAPAAVPELVVVPSPTPPPPAPPGPGPEPPR